MTEQHNAPRYKLSIDLGTCADPFTRLERVREQLAQARLLNVPMGTTAEELQAWCDRVGVTWTVETEAPPECPPVKSLRGLHDGIVHYDDAPFAPTIADASREMLHIDIGAVSQPLTALEVVRAAMTAPGGCPIAVRLANGSWIQPQLPVVDSLIACLKAGQEIATLKSQLVQEDPTDQGDDDDEQELIVRRVAALVGPLMVVSRAEQQPTVHELQRQLAVRGLGNPMEGERIRYGYVDQHENFYPYRRPAMQYFDPTTRDGLRGQMVVEEAPEGVNTVGDFCDWLGARGPIPLDATWGWVKEDLRFHKQKSALCIPAEDRAKPLQEWRLKLIDREFCETDERWLQLLPYAVIRRAEDGHLLQYTRGRKGDERGLHDKDSIGGGGHVDRLPQEGESLAQLLARECWRELVEEFGLKAEVLFGGERTVVNYIAALLAEGRYTPIYLTDATPVERVHLGLAFVLDLPAEMLGQVEEGHIVDPVFQPLYTVAQNPRLEPWSRFMVRQLGDALLKQA